MAVETRGWRPPDVIPAFISGLLLLIHGVHQTTGTVPNCDVPGDNDLFCLDCDIDFFNGYSYVNTDKGCCRRCPLYCAECEESGTQCNNKGTCTRCEPGYILSDDRESCHSCYDNALSGLPICLNCDSWRYGTGDNPRCNRCTETYFINILQNNSCTQCGDGCLECSTALQCIRCPPGTYNSNGRCLGCPPNCQLCNDGNNCNRCTIGYYLLNNICNACPGNTNLELSCENCDISRNVKCDTCMRNYVKGLTQCYSCPAGCEDCHEDSTYSELLYCDVCANNHEALAHPECVQVSCSVTFCDVCASLTSCLFCITGYYLANDGTCTACTNIHAECIDCAGASACTLCSDTYYISGGTCVECSLSGLSNCLRCSSAITCTGCEAGFYLNGGTCDECWTPTQTECPRCVRTSDMTYYAWSILTVNPVQQGFCRLHDVPGCKLADVNNVCTECTDNYRLVAGACLPCTTASTYAECLQCKGYYQGRCKYVQCSTSLTDSAECNACVDLAWMTNTEVTGDCEDCHIQMENTDCNNCGERLTDFCMTADCNGVVNDEERCTSCQGKYWVTGSPDQCHSVTCQLNHLDTEPKCNACPGFRWETGTTPPECQKCADSNCISCPTSQSACAQCRDNCYHDGTSCILVNCVEPTTLPLAQCNACPGYYSDGTNCVTKPEAGCGGEDEAGCWLCRVYGYVWDGSSCTKSCVAGAGLTAATCGPCMYLHMDAGSCQVRAPYTTNFEEKTVYNVPCAGTIHSTPATCTLCKARVYSAPNCQVVTCDIRTIASLSSTNCNACNGFSYYSTTCNKCPDNCVSCSSNTVCTKCTFGYSLIGTSCSATSCTTPTSLGSDRCQDCVGYYWSGSQCIQITNPAKQCPNFNSQSLCDTCRVYDYVWVGSSCLPCSSSSVSASLRCEMCTNTMWNNMAASGAQCQYVQNRAREDPWHRKVAQLDIITATTKTGWDPTATHCKEDMNSPGECLYCAGRYFASSVCKAVSCTDPTQLPQTTCQACPGAFWDATNGCRVCDDNCLKCATVSTCDVCMDGYYLSGGACLLVANCYDLNSFVNDAEKCLACPGYYFDTTCKPVTEAACNLKINTNERDCWHCRSLGFIHDGTQCLRLCDAGVDLDDPRRCKRMGCRKTKWEGGECLAKQYLTWNGGLGDRPWTCSTSIYDSDFEQCRCLGRRWVGVCTGYSSACNVDAVDVISERLCGLCDNKMWQNGDSMCHNVTVCTASQSECDSCANYYWDTDLDRCIQYSTADMSAVSQLECTGGIYDTQTRCGKCNVDKRIINNRAYIWTLTGGNCYLCDTSGNVQPTRADTCVNCQWSDMDYPSDRCLEACGLITDCLKCTGGNCDVCVFGKAWISSDSACKACGSISQTECETCGLPAYPLVTGFSSLWIPTDPPSNTPTKCSVCSSGITFTSLNCNQCSGRTRYWSSNDCRLCPTECGTCTTLGVCITCAVGYTLQAGICSRCSISNCEVCSGSSCGRCAAGYCFNLGNSLCEPMAANKNCDRCYRVAGINQCVTCLTGFNMKYCSNCTTGPVSVCSIANCIACNALNSACTECLPGYYVNRLGTCSRCDALISQCVRCRLDSLQSTLVQEVIQCLDCAYSFGLSRNLCLPCDLVHPQCSHCRAVETCQYCDNDYDLAPDNRTCIPYCVSCRGPSCFTPSTSSNSNTRAPCPGLLTGQSTCMAHGVYSKNKNKKSSAFMYRGCYHLDSDQVRETCNRQDCEATSEDQRACARCCNGTSLCNRWADTEIVSFHDDAASLRPAWLHVITMTTVVIVTLMSL